MGVCNFCLYVLIHCLSFEFLVQYDSERAFGDSGGSNNNGCEYGVAADLNDTATDQSCFYKIFCRSGTGAGSISRKNTSLHVNKYSGSISNEIMLSLVSGHNIDKLIQRMSDLRKNVPMYRCVAHSFLRLCAIVFSVLHPIQACGDFLVNTGTDSGRLCVRSCNGQYSCPYRQAYPSSGSRSSRKGWSFFEEET